MSMYNELEFLIIIFAMSAIFSFLCTPIFSKTAIKFGILDRPNQAHKTHSDPIPYLGGFSIFIPLVIVLMVIAMNLADTNLRMVLYGVLIGISMMSVIGLFDDVKNVSAGLRLFFQIATSIWIVAISNYYGFSREITGLITLDLLLSILWIVAITNAFNLLDNLDGASTGVSVTISAAFCLLCLSTSQGALGLCASTICGAGFGFMFWNKFPARIYLGDSGALVVGTAIASISLLWRNSDDNQLYNLFVPIIILAIPIIDTSVVIISRLMQKQPVMLGGRDHLSHRLLAAGYSKKSSARLLWLSSLIFCGLGIIAHESEKNMGSFILATGVLMMLICVAGFLRLTTEKKPFPV